MEDIVYKFIGERDQEMARVFMLHFVQKGNNQYSWENCWVVESEGKVVAAVNLYDGGRLAELRKPVVEYLRKQSNRDLIVDDETQAGEYYVDALGVTPDQQGNGIGTQLLQFIIDEYVTMRNQTLGLLVDESNPGAKRLYLKLGFKHAGRKVFFGKNMDHMQINGLPLPPP
jgi:ribosomal protein S18 acetylase RimI-like enzyme